MPNMAAGQTQTFAVPVVLQNLPPAETLNQVVDNLNYLCNVFDTAFETISHQINAERSKIQSLQKRIAKASSKTDLIAKYPNKSTTVFSHCEFPKPIQEKDTPLISATEPTKYIQRPKYNLPIDQRLQRPPNCDTLKLFHSISEKTAPKQEERIVGLGKLPSWLDNVGDCLLFNTDTNPYLKYETIQNLEGQEGVDKESEQKKMFNAPQSIRDKQNLIDKETYDIAYRPDLENVPRFQVNTTLSGFAGMGGVALDAKWLGFKKQQNKIAPSGIDFGQLPELEALPDFGGDDEFGFGDAPAPPPPKAPTPPPQPPRNTEMNNNGNNNNTQNAAAQSSKPATNAPAAPISAAPKEPAAAPIAKPKPSGGGGRGALLDAIRAGSKLKKRTERKQSAKAKQQAARDRPPSLMDHLKSRLAARNSIMSGNKQATAVKSPIKMPDRIDEDDTMSQIDLLKSPTESPQNDRTGLGLANLPQSIRTSMLLVDELDNSMSSGTDSDWNADD